MIDFTEEEIIINHCQQLRFFIDKYEKRFKRLKCIRKRTYDVRLNHWLKLIHKSFELLKLEDDAITWTLFGSKRYMNKKTLNDFDLYHIMKINKQLKYPKLWNDY